MHRLVTFVAGTVVGGGAIYALSSLGHGRSATPTAPVQAPNAPMQQPLQAPPAKFGRMSVVDDNTGNEFLKYGNPGPVSDFLLRSRYAASYNRALRNPNWVAEHLTQDNLKGTADRASSEFKEDPLVPAPFRALLKDYYRSG
ncbi:nuclease, partial [Coemansia sp. RSA 2673]